MERGTNKGTGSRGGTAENQTTRNLGKKDKVAQTALHMKVKAVQMQRLVDAQGTEF